MKLLNRTVIHDHFGTGTIKSIEDNRITISFSEEDKTFVYPDAFVSYLHATDENVAKYILELLKHYEQKKIDKDLSNKKKAQKAKDAKKRNTIKSKKVARSNIAFKCNFCDGGRTDSRVGFHGVCSDSIITNNIEVEHRAWCSSRDSYCLKYLNGEISREELERPFLDGDSVCYESQMLRDWTAFAGVVHTGKRKGEPMKLQKVQNNSLTILTTRNPQSSEGERYIFAVFLVDESYAGDSLEAGYVTTNSKYKIELTPSESESMLFWNYYCNRSNPQRPMWGSGLHRYFTDEIAAQILNDIAKLKEGTEDHDLANEFLEHFCKINGVNLTEIGEPNGALKR